MSEANLVEEARVKATQTPKRKQEYKFVEEIIDITKCTTENLSRSDVDRNKNIYWNAITKTNTKVRETTLATENEMMVEENRSHEEKIMSVLTDTLLDDPNKQNNQSHNYFDDEILASSDPIAINGTIDGGNDFADNDREDAIDARLKTRLNRYNRLKTYTIIANRQ